MLRRRQRRGRAAARRRSCGPAAIVVDGVLPGIDGATVIRRIRLDAALRGLAVPAADRLGGSRRRGSARSMPAPTPSCARRRTSASSSRGSAPCCAAPAHQIRQARHRRACSGRRRFSPSTTARPICRQLAEALRADGYEVVLARSGEEALELLAVQPVDCILLDLLMPGIGGRETCRRLKSVPVMRDIPDRHADRGR